MVEIGAGGGSIAWIDELGRISVGPESAGAQPGPACHAFGGREPTVTDANVVMGRISPHHFAGGKVALAPARAEDALRDGIGDAMALSPDAAAFGVTEVVCENMASAARVHAIESGKNADDRTLIAFGERLVLELPGGGGYGDPAERDPAAVAEDVLDGLITVRDAECDYGVVLHEDGFPDEEATDAFRCRRRTAGPDQARG